MTIKADKLIKATFIIVLFQGIIASYLGFGLINYMCDAMILLTLVLMPFFKPKFKKGQKLILIPLVLFTMWVVVSAIYNEPNIYQTLWGVRNNYKFFLFFIMCLLWLKDETVHWMARVLEVSFYLHIVLTAYQYLVEKLQRDFLGGIWGREQGCNSGLFIYLVLLLCIEVYKYHKAQITIRTLSVYIAVMCANAILAELKFFFLAVIMLVAIYLCVSRRKLKILLIAAVLAVSMPIAANILENMYPEFGNVLSKEYISKKLFEDEHYSSRHDVGRTTVFETLTPILKEWKNTDTTLWTGIGLGAGDYSGLISKANSEFYGKYEELHYTWFSLSFMFVELGYVGVFFYISFFALIFINSIYRYRKYRQDKYLFSTLIAAASIMIILYNGSMRTNYALIMFWALAIPYVVDSDDLFKKTKVTRLKLRV